MKHMISQVNGVSERSQKHRYIADWLVNMSKPKNMKSIKPKYSKLVFALQITLILHFLMWVGMHYADIGRTRDVRSQSSCTITSAYIHKSYNCSLDCSSCESTTSEISCSRALEMASEYSTQKYRTDQVCNNGNGLIYNNCCKSTLNVGCHMKCIPNLKIIFTVDHKRGNGTVIKDFGTEVQAAELYYYLFKIEDSFWCADKLENPEEFILYAYPNVWWNRFINMCISMPIIWMLIYVSMRKEVIYLFWREKFEI
jgi:hypothetical protein